MLSMENSLSKPKPGKKIKAIWL